MKTLLWKDFRQNQNTLIAVGAFLILPYVIALTINLSAKARGYWTDHEQQRAVSSYVTSQQSLSLAIGNASAFSLILGVVAVAFIAGNTFAGERADRSAEFLAYLPIPRERSMISKAILAIGVCLSLFVFNAAVGWWCGLPYNDPRSLGSFLSILGVSAILIFGASWFFSTFMQSPAIAAASGILITCLLVGSLLLIDYTVTEDLYEWERISITRRWYPFLATMVGLGMFVAGAVYYPRRIEP